MNFYYDLADEGGKISTLDLEFDEIHEIIDKNTEYLEWNNDSQLKSLGLENNEDLAKNPLHIYNQAYDLNKELEFDLARKSKNFKIQ